MSPLLQALFALVLIMLALQIGAATIIWNAGRRRQQRTLPSGFPQLEELPTLSVNVNEVTLYTSGNPLYEDMLAAIRSASSSILLETFIWKNDEIGRAFDEAIIERAKAGVKVYVTYDSVGNRVLGGSPKVFPQLENLFVLPYRPFRNPLHLLLPRYYSLDHRKLLIVDQRIGFVGGYNIGKEYGDQWRDTHIRLSGEAARDLSYAFADFWIINGNAEIAIELPLRPWSPVIRVHRNDPVRRSYPIRAMYLEAIEHAKDRIWITNAYFVPDVYIRNALLRAAHRGVDVRILVPWRSNHFIVDWLARHRFTTYLEGGVRIFGFKDAMIHAKTATIDGVWSMVGTANLDRLSLAGNYEINVEIFDGAVAALMQEIFECDLTNAFELTLERWKRRPLSQRAGEVILSPLWPFV